MEPMNKCELLTLLENHPEWSVLDVGGGEQPLMRADWVIDVIPFMESGKQGVIGDNTKTHVSPDRWVQRDICGGTWPFKDKSFDFVFCSNVLEDVRDPLSVIQEINRVGKRGYIEIPSPSHETKKGVETVFDRSYDYIGYWHHRWFVYYSEKQLWFLPKFQYASLVIDGFPNRENRHKQESFVPIYWENIIKGTEIMVANQDMYRRVLECFLMNKSFTETWGIKEEY